MCTIILKLDGCNVVVMSFVTPTVVAGRKILRKAWCTASRSIRLGLRSAYRRLAGGPFRPQGGHHRAICHFDLMSFASTRDTGTLRDNSRVLTDLAHGASQPKPATPIVAFFFRLPPGTKVSCKSVDRASPDDPPPLLSDRSHKLASTALAFDQPVIDVCSVILYGPQAPPNKI
jgi:hypothetical protein